MHDIEDQTGQQGLVDERPGEQLPDTRTDKPTQNYTTRAESPRLPDAWKIGMIAGAVILILAVIFAGVLSGNPVPSQSGSVSRPSPVSTTGTHKSNVLLNPTATAIPARTLTGHYINFTIVNGVMFAATVDNAVYALRLNDGAVLWHQKIDGSAYTQPFIFNGIVYVDSSPGQNGPDHVYALRASDGNILWSYTSAGYIYTSPSSVDAGLIYLASPEGISALSASSGSTLWHVATRGPGDNQPVVAGGVVYATSSEGGPDTLVALRASDGKLLWQHQAENPLSVLLVSGGTVYISSGKLTLAALRTSDGHQLWQRAIDVNFIQPPQLVDGVLYTAGTKITEPPAALSTNPLQGVAALGSLLWNTFRASLAQPARPHKLGQSSFYAIRASDGTMLWHSPMGTGNSTWANWFTVERGVVYGASINSSNSGTNTGDIYALQASDGVPIWHDELTQSQPYSAQLNNGVIYLGADVGSGNSPLYALRAGDGSLLWSYPIASTTVTMMMRDGPMLYAGAANGMVYALQASSGVVKWHYQTDVGS